MLTLTTRTNKGKETIYCPDKWEGEVSVSQFQELIKHGDEDWIKIFSILTNQEYDSISESTDNKMEGVLYKAIEFVFTPFDFDKLPMPKVFEMQTVWAKDSPLIAPVQIPSISRMSIGQNIQARKSIEGLKDLREGMSIVTAIYLQPLIDKSKFDMLRAIEIEQIILKMPITRVYPVGFFLLRRLKNNGNKFTRIWNQLKQLLTKNVKALGRSRGQKG